MSEIKSLAAEEFSLTRGGPLHWLLVRLGHAGEERQRVIRRAFFAVLATWFPLLILSLIQGRAYGTQITIPFLGDLAVNARFLIAAPILILAESGIDRRWRLLVLQFLRAGLVRKKELPAFEAVIARTSRLRDRVLPEASLLVASFLPVFILKTEALISGVSNWHTLEWDQAK